MFEYSKEEFELAYKSIYNEVKKDKVPQEKYCVFFVGGQPGSGKTYFHSQDDGFEQYISIDGDRYRKYHPHYAKICQKDIGNMATLTQDFVNRCVERLIQDLSDKNYNLIIEGTLRESKTTINTCLYLKEKGYTTHLYVMAISAITSWESCSNRAKLLSEIGEMPRTVPLEKYNYIVNNIVSSLQEIEKSGCFDNIKVIDRNNKILYPNRKMLTASQTLDSVLDVAAWNEKYKGITLISQNELQKGIERKRKGR